MTEKQSDYDKEKILSDFCDILPMLRTRLGITQKELGARIGTTRHTIMWIESKKNPLTWSMFLSLAFLFFIDPRTRPFLIASGIINNELSASLFGDASLLSETSSKLSQDAPFLSKAQQMMDNLKTNIGDNSE